MGLQKSLGYGSQLNLATNGNNKNNNVNNSAVGSPNNMVAATLQSPRGGLSLCLSNPWRHSQVLGGEVVLRPRGNGSHGRHGFINTVRCQTVASPPTQTKQVPKLS